EVTKSSYFFMPGSWKMNSTMKSPAFSYKSASSSSSRAMSDPSARDFPVRVACLLSPLARSNSNSLSEISWDMSGSSTTQQDCLRGFFLRRISDRDGASDVNCLVIGGHSNRKPGARDRIAPLVWGSVEGNQLDGLLTG